MITHCSPACDHLLGQVGLLAACGMERVRTFIEILCHWPLLVWILHFLCFLCGILNYDKVPSKYLSISLPSLSLGFGVCCYPHFFRGKTFPHKEARGRRGCQCWTGTAREGLVPSTIVSASVAGTLQAHSLHQSLSTETHSFSDAVWMGCVCACLLVK